MAHVFRSMTAAAVILALGGCGRSDESANNVTWLNTANVAGEENMVANAVVHDSDAVPEPATATRPTQSAKPAPPKPPRADPPPVQPKPVPAPDPHAGHDMNQMNSN